MRYLSQSLPLIYYPFTIISSSLLEALTPSFPRIVLYRPVGSDVMPEVKIWIDNGSLEVRVPFEGIVDKQTVERELRQWKTWGLLHRDGGLAYLKAVTDGMALPDPSVPKLVSELKAALREVKPAPRSGDVVIQLFLHLAQDLDTRSREVVQDVVRFNRQEKALHESLRRDDTKEEPPEMPQGSFTWSREDLGAIMTASRMKAWNYLFQNDHEEAMLLFTDSAAAQAWLLEPVEEIVEVGELAVPCHKPPTNNLSDKIPIAEFFQELIFSPWSDELRKRVEETGSRLQEMSENKDERSRQLSQRNRSVRWSLVPNETPCSLLNKACGRKTKCDTPSGARNTLAGLFENRE
jgi:hypothetical protein